MKTLAEILWLSVVTCTRVGPLNQSGLGKSTFYIPYPKEATQDKTKWHLKDFNVSFRDGNVSF